MTTLDFTPAHLRISTLRTFDTPELCSLAAKSNGSLTSVRVVLGRCLLALEERKAHKEMGYSTVIHYATASLGMEGWEAKACRRVARQLLPLPRLSTEAEQGRIDWSKLREIVRKASEETESLWIELAKVHSATSIRDLVTKTPKGAVPGDVDETECSYTSEFRCNLKPEVFQMLAEARRVYSVERGEAVKNADLIEMAMATLLSQRPLDNEAMEKVRREADKDLQAERARREPAVREARQLAAEMGVLKSDEGGGAETIHGDRLDDDAEKGSTWIASDDEPESLEDLLGQALGGAPLTNLSLENASEVLLNREREVRQLLEQAVNGTAHSEPEWVNKRLRYNPDARHPTKAQKKEILRRDGYCCRTPGCPNRVFLQVHHMIPYSEGGKTLPWSLLGLCSGCHRNHSPWTAPHRHRERQARLSQSVRRPIGSPGRPGPGQLDKPRTRLHGR